VGAVSLQLMFGCRWYALLLARSVNTQLALCGAWSGAFDVTGRRLIAMAGRLQLKSADGVDAWKTAGSVVLHWDSLDGACSSVKPDEARELIWMVPTEVFADLLLLLVTLRLTERVTRTAGTVRVNRPEASSLLAELNCVISLTALRRTQVKPLLATIHVAFVGYHGKSCLSG
jgi:hypothetical protein